MTATKVRKDRSSKHGNNTWWKRKEVTYLDWLLLGYSFRAQRFQSLLSVSPQLGHCNIGIALLPRPQQDTVHSQYAINRAKQLTGSGVKARTHRVALSVQPCLGHFVVASHLRQCALTQLRGRHVLLLNAHQMAQRPALTK
jgi:hypothetical protein